MQVAQACEIETVGKRKGGGAWGKERENRGSSVLNNLSHSTDYSGTSCEAAESRLFTSNMQSTRYASEHGDHRSQRKNHLCPIQQASNLLIERTLQDLICIIVPTFSPNGRLVYLQSSNNGRSPQEPNAQQRRKSPHTPGYR